MYRSPDIRTLGIELDVPKGLVVKEVRDAVAAAGMIAGDRIAAINGTPVWTFGDLQHHYDKVNRNADRIQMTVDRAGSADRPAHRAARALVVDRPHFPSVDHRTACVLRLRAAHGSREA